MKKKTTTNKKVNQFKSKFEENVFNQLTNLFKKEPVFYEGPFNIIYYHTKPEKHRYTCDFCLPNNIFIETKGLFTTKDRKKHLLIRTSNPSLDIRFIFQNAKNKIKKGSKTTYADWCNKHGFKWSHKIVPSKWVREKK
mmetsp:Transcript_22789/g.10988  ORF Transcript_22789/g.10988 Transcript_22789/m.10988 type:complete len:138 (-) Transcript_22789:534-947(-)